MREVGSAGWNGPYAFGEREICPRRGREPQSGLPNRRALIGPNGHYWNEFLFAIILTKPSQWPVTVALNNLAGSQIVEWNVQMAGALLAAVPTLLIYLFLGRYFMRGLMAGALKG